jgi:hypothetical protein
MQPIGKDLPPPLSPSRTGHGAASVIPYLNDLIPLEPSQLCEPEDLAHAEDPSADRQETIAIPG